MSTRGSRARSYVGAALKDLDELPGGCGQAERFFNPHVHDRKVCPKCKRRYPANMQFCPECKGYTKLEPDNYAVKLNPTGKICPVCGNKYPLEVRYCPICSREDDPVYLRDR